MLFLPGYLLARAARLPAAASAAYPLSAVILTLAVIGFTWLGFPLRFWPVVAVICLATGAGYYSLLVLPLSPVPDTPATAPLPMRVVGLAVAGLVAVVLLYRMSVWPLAGPDTPFRWEALARVMLETDGLVHYPPVSHIDFGHYFYCDGIPPLTSGVYWFLYAAHGQPWPAITAIPVALQLVAAFGLVFHGGKALSGTAGGFVSLTLLAATPLFIRAVGIGQETGYTALAVAGQLLYGRLARGPGGIQCAVAAGAFAGLGALAREYGVALGIAGLASLAWLGGPRFRLLPFVLTAAAIAAPWYVRNWLRTGNPVYCLDVLGFPVNQVYAGIMTEYQRKFALSSLPLASWTGLARDVSIGAGPVVLAGIIGVVAGWRKAAPAGLVAAVTVALWLWSVGYTAGGLAYSLRVLAPAWVALAVAASGPGASLAARRWSTWGWAVLATGFGGFAVLFAWAHPQGVTEIDWRAPRVGPDLTSDANRGWLSHHLTTSRLEPGKVLTENCFLAIALRHNTRFPPVMVWDPDLAFLFDAALPPAEVRRRLLSKGVRYVALYRRHPSNSYLLRFNFFHSDERTLDPILTDPQYVLFALPRDGPDSRPGT
jgi:hypothetical protein